MIETIIVGFLVGMGIGVTIGVFYALRPKTTMALMIGGLGISSGLAALQPTVKLTSDLNLAYHIPYITGVIIGVQVGRIIPAMVERDCGYCQKQRPD